MRKLDVLTVCYCVSDDVTCFHTAVSGSSDESTHGEVPDHSILNNVLQPSPGQSSRPSGQSSRPSSRQGQKYTSATATAAAAATPVVMGYRDGVLPSRKVSIILQFSCFSSFFLLQVWDRHQLGT